MQASIHYACCGQGWWDPRPVCYVSSSFLPGETECSLKVPWGSRKPTGGCLRCGEYLSVGILMLNHPLTEGPPWGLPWARKSREHPGPCSSSYPTPCSSTLAAGGRGGGECLQGWKGNLGPGQARQAAEGLETQPVPPVGPRGARGPGLAGLLHTGARRPERQCWVSSSCMYLRAKNTQHNPDHARKARGA